MIVKLKVEKLLIVLGWQNLVGCQIKKTKKNGKDTERKSNNNNKNTRIESGKSNIVLHSTKTKHLPPKKKLNKSKRKINLIKFVK